MLAMGVYVLDSRNNYSKSPSSKYIESVNLCILNTHSPDSSPDKLKYHARLHLIFKFCMIKYMYKYMSLIYGGELFMRLRQVADILGADILCCRDKLDLEIYYAFSSDLMSDVLSYANKKTLLLTGLINPQVVRTAEMIDMPAIVFVRNKKPGDIIMKLAHENNFVILSTSHSLYTASGLLYASGLKGIQIDS